MDNHCPPPAVSCAAFLSRPPVLLSSLGPQPAPLQGVSLSQAQDFTFVMVEFYEVLVGPVL